MRPTVGLVLMLAVLEKVVDYEHKQTYKRTSIHKVYSLELTLVFFCQGVQRKWEMIKTTVFDWKVRFGSIEREIEKLKV